jgi:hypothetical protein
MGSFLLLEIKIRVCAIRARARNSPSQWLSRFQPRAYVGGRQRWRLHSTQRLLHSFVSSGTS